MKLTKFGSVQVQRVTCKYFGFSSAVTAVLAGVCTSAAGHMSANTAVSAQDPKNHVL